MVSSKDALLPTRIGPAGTRYIIFRSFCLALSGTLLFYSDARVNLPLRNAIIHVPDQVLQDACAVRALRPLLALSLSTKGYERSERLFHQSRRDHPACFLNVPITPLLDEHCRCFRYGRISRAACWLMPAPLGGVITSVTSFAGILTKTLRSRDLDRTFDKARRSFASFVECRQW